MKVVILAGGFGTRISEESDLKPKPIIEMGDGHASRQELSGKPLGLGKGSMEDMGLTVK